MTSVAKFTKRYSTFRPTDIPGCRSWMDALDTSSYTLSGSTVTAVTDKADNNPFTITGSITININSAFNITSGSLKKTITPIPLYPHTTFIVAKMESIPPAGSPCVALAGNINGSSQFYRSLDYASSTFRTVAFAQSVIVAASTGFVNNNYFMFNETYSDRTISSRYYYAGPTQVTYGTSGTGTNFNTSASVILIGTDGATGQTGTFTWPGPVAEVILYDSVLSETQRQTIEGYLAWKWGTVTFLPSTHLYKTVPFYT